MNSEVILVGPGFSFDANLFANGALKQGAKAHGQWHVECYGPDGKLKWSDDFHNLVTNQGLNHILTAVIAGGTQITSWFVGLASSSPTPAAADTLASHGGWTEITDYSGNRKAFTAGSVSGQSVDNSASKASFAINTTVTVGGAFLASVNTGTSGTLYSIGAFTGGNRALQNGDTLNVQATFTQADDGV